MAVEFRDDPLMDTPELQGEVKRVVEQVNNGAVVTVLFDVAIGTAETPVAHGLGYAPRSASLTPHSSAAWSRTRAPDAQNVYFVAASAIRADVNVFP